jgi:hypothetical protein
MNSRARSATITHWDPARVRKATWPQTPIARVEVRRNLAVSGRLSAVVESGTVIALRVEPGISMGSKPRARKRPSDAEGIEYASHPGGRIIAVEGRPVR